MASKTVFCFKKYGTQSVYHIFYSTAVVGYSYILMLIECCEVGGTKQRPCLAGEKGTAVCGNGITHYLMFKTIKICENVAKIIEIPLDKCYNTMKTLLR